MPFRFSLAPVLRVRESVEKRQETALHAAQLELARTRRRIDELTHEMARAWEKREQALRETIPANRLQTMQAEINAAVEARQTLQETSQTLKCDRDLQMKLYTAAHASRQIITDLLAQKKSAYLQQEVRAEQKMLDSVVAARWQRY
jgi:flagellar export protein FliJ